MQASQISSWNNALEQIRANVSEKVYNTWFKIITLENYDEASNVIILQVPSPFVAEYLEENYVDLLKKALRNNFGLKVILKYRVVTDKEHGMTQTVTSAPESDGMPQGSAKPRSLARQTAPQPQQPVTFDSQLNPQQTFDNYIEGVCNKLPLSVGQSLAEHPNTPQFNPFFIYGPSGSGKTHLINAIGMRTLEIFPQSRVLYVSARTFQMQYTTAQSQNVINDFINFYQTIDVLIVDDIQEWEDKKGTQNTFFHIFNHLWRNGKRIILAADRTPKELQGITDRLLTRFSCGLVAELERPNEQLCLDFLTKSVSREGLAIPGDVIQFIAQNANGSVRDLQGVVNSLMAYSVVYHRNVDMRLAECVMKRAVKVNDEPLTVDEIIESVCNHFNVSASAVNGKSRKRVYVMARQVSMFLAQKHTKMPASRIGKLIGNRDHSTVIHSCSKVEDRMKIDQEFSDEIQSIENSFKLKKM